MCIQASPAKLNNVKGIYNVAMKIFTQRFIEAGRVTERKIINTGMVTEMSATKINPCVISNTNTLPFMISSILIGKYKEK